MKTINIEEPDLDIFKKFRVLEKLQPFFPILLALSVLKMPFGFKLYFNIIPILIGFLYLVSFRRVASYLYPLVLMLSLGFFVSMYHGDWKGVLRLGQVFCMAGFLMQLSQFKRKDYLLFLKYLVGIFIVVYLVEVMIGSVSFSRMLFGFKLSRYSGPVGEVNYSAIILAGMTLLFLFFNRLKWYFFSFAMLFFSNSRTAFLMICYGSLVLPRLNSKIFKKIQNYLNNSLLIVFFLTPVLIYLLHLYGPMELKVFLEKASSGRFYLYVPYVDMGIEHFLGIGYFRGWENYHIFLEPIKDLVDSIRGSQLNEQHNIFIQVFSEFGLIGYCFFISFLGLIYIEVKKNSEFEFEKRISLFVSLLIGYSLLNGLNDMIFYLILSVVINKNFLTNAEE